MVSGIKIIQKTTQKTVQKAAKKFKKISTHLLTVLIISVILQLEQKRNNKTKGFFWKVLNDSIQKHIGLSQSAKIRAVFATLPTAVNKFLYHGKGEMTYDDAQYFWRGFV